MPYYSRYEQTMWIFGRLSERGCPYSCEFDYHLHYNNVLCKVHSHIAVCIKFTVISHHLQVDLIIGCVPYIEAIDVVISQIPALFHYIAQPVQGVVWHNIDRHTSWEVCTLCEDVISMLQCKLFDLVAHTWPTMV